MSPLFFGAILGAGLGVHDWNVPGELRLEQVPEVPVYAQLAFGPRTIPYLYGYFESTVWLRGNNNPPVGLLPHAPQEATWGTGIRYDKDWWYVDLQHTSFHVVPSPSIFATRQWTGIEFGFRFGDLKLTSPHCPPGL